MNSHFNIKLFADLPDRNVIIYDGECPFCSQFVAFQRLRSSLGSVSLIDARRRPDLVAEFDRLGMPLDEGMALIMSSEIYYGADCLNRLALLSSGSSILNRVSAFVFSSPRTSRLLYPVLKAGRRIVLTIMGKSKLGKS